MKDENFKMCLSISKELDDVVEGKLHKCPYCHNTFKLNTTNEIICLNEELIGEDYIFSLCVTDNLTELDFSRNYAEICTLKKQMKSTEIYYGADTVT